ncbi:MAG: hypothetical protein ACRDNZ_15225, partial [Streptosporangiaceae bacterium]
ARPPVAARLANRGVLAPAWETGELAAALGGLAGMLQARLEQAAGTARAPDDQVACQEAARHARQIRALLPDDRP